MSIRPTSSTNSTIPISELETSCIKLVQSRFAWDSVMRERRDAKNTFKKRDPREVTRIDQVKGSLKTNERGLVDKFTPIAKTTLGLAVVDRHVPLPPKKQTPKVIKNQAIFLVREVIRNLLPKFAQLEESNPENQGLKEFATKLSQRWAPIR